MPDIEPFKIAELANFVGKGSQLVVPEVQLGQITKSGDPVDVADAVSAELQPIYFLEVLDDELDVGKMIVGQLEVVDVIHTLLLALDD